MFLGHFAVALAARRAAPQTSLATTVFAAQFLDLLWPLLLLANVERVEIVPGLMAASPLDFVSYPISHSLLMAAVWGLAAGGVYFLVRRRLRAAVVIGLVVLSHWLLDAPMHRPDLPLWPGSSTVVGAGLWHSLGATLGLELLLLALGVWLYVRGTRPLNRVGSIALWSMIGLLVAVFLGSLLGPPPASAAGLAVAALALWLFVPWAWWVDRNRVSAERPVSRPAVPPQDRRALHGAQAAATQGRPR